MPLWRAAHLICGRFVESLLLVVRNVIIIIIIIITFIIIIIIITIILVIIIIIVVIVYIVNYELLYYKLWIFLKGAPEGAEQPIRLSIYFFRIFSFQDFQVPEINF